MLSANVSHFLLRIRREWNTCEHIMHIKVTTLESKVNDKQYWYVFGVALVDSCSLEILCKYILASSS